MSGDNQTTQDVVEQAVDGFRSGIGKVGGWFGYGYSMVGITDDLVSGAEEKANEEMEARLTGKTDNLIDSIMSKENPGDNDSDDGEAPECGPAGGGGDGPDGGSDGGQCRPPIILDLDGDGVELVSLSESSVFYDINGNGYRYNMSWAGGGRRFAGV